MIFKKYSKEGNEGCKKEYGIGGQLKKQSKMIYLNSNRPIIILNISRLNTLVKKQLSEGEKNNYM